MRYECQIFGRPCIIELDDKELIKACEEYGLEEDSTTGVYIHAEHRIIVSPEQEPRAIVHTILHELLHAIGHITGHFNLSHSTPKNEAMIDTVADGLCDALANKTIFFVLGALLGHIKVAKEESI